MADAAGTVLDWTSRYMEARKLIGVGSGAPGGLGFVSPMLMASSAYEQSNGPLEFAREIAKSVAMDQVGKAIVRYTLAGAEGAIEGAPLGPVGAATAGTAAVLTLTYGGSIIDGVSSYGRREANCQSAWNVDPQSAPNIDPSCGDLIV